LKALYMPNRFIRRILSSVEMFMMFYLEVSK
jgi:hypothetical protein